MADTDTGRRPASEVDYLVDEKASKLNVPDEAHFAPARDGEPSVAATGPTNWWRTGLIVMAMLIALLLVLQIAGGWPGTDVQPGTPVAEPQSAPADGS